MNRKIITYLSFIFAVFTLGTVISMIYIHVTTIQIKKIIMFHSVEVLGLDLIIKIKDVEQDLLTVNTEFSRTHDKIISNVTDLNIAINECLSCHSKHSSQINQRLSDVNVNIQHFKTSLNDYVAAANEEQIKSLRIESFKIGKELLDLTSDMAFISNDKLHEITQNVIRRIRIAQYILIITLVTMFIIALWIAFSLTKKIVYPIKELTDISRKIAAGSFGYTTNYSDLTEIGELAKSFNEMSLSLKGSNERIVNNLNALTGLYRVTLPFLSLTNIKEVFKEVSYGIADFLEVEQCGLMMLNNESEYFEHRYPAFGLDQTQINSMRVFKDDLLEFYFSNNRRPLIINNPVTEGLPAGLIGGNDLNVRNMLLGWVRHKGELIGVIRLANNNEGEFFEESAKLLGIISNNVSVAIENTRLYENLNNQMQELKDTQEQLVQAAKLAAIGELSSNVAHEINNPLTSIIGFAELIKEETNIRNIMNYVEIIEKESLRARDIVQQLLEFSRKRNLDLTKFDINSLIRESVSLVGVQIKNRRIRIVENLFDIPLIMGDKNQLKQVFINLINNSVDAMSGIDGEISIRTAVNGTNITIEIEDNGNGIPKEILPRIFEPFFTTKKDKGTGLGLAIAYKIIQSHNGRIDIKSEEGKGTRFKISLPVYVSDSEYSQVKA